MSDPSVIFKQTNLFSAQVYLASIVGTFESDFFFTLTVSNRHAHTHTLSLALTHTRSLSLTYLPTITRSSFTIAVKIHLYVLLERIAAF